MTQTAAIDDDILAPLFHIHRNCHDHSNRFVFSLFTEGSSDEAPSPLKPIFRKALRIIDITLSNKSRPSSQEVLTHQRTKRVTPRYTSPIKRYTRRSALSKVQNENETRNAIILRETDVSERVHNEGRKEDIRPHKKSIRKGEEYC
jgi:hypothetical protein